MSVSLVIHFDCNRISPGIGNGNCIAWDDKANFNNNPIPHWRVEKRAEHPLEIISTSVCIIVNAPSAR